MILGAPAAENHNLELAISRWLRSYWTYRNQTDQESEEALFEAEANLRREAVARGADPARIVFADTLPLAEHLARHRAADLFLDTLPYNAHTTASDALWSGLPVVTSVPETSLPV